MAKSKGGGFRGHNAKTGSAPAYSTSEPHAAGVGAARRSPDQGESQGSLINILAGVPPSLTHTPTGNARSA